MINSDNFWCFSKISGKHLRRSISPLWEEYTEDHHQEYTSPEQRKGKIKRTVCVPQKTWDSTFLSLCRTLRQLPPSVYKLSTEHLWFWEPAVHEKTQQNTPTEMYWSDMLILSIIVDVRTGFWAQSPNHTPGTINLVNPLEINC